MNKQKMKDLIDRSTKELENLEHISLEPQFFEKVCDIWLQEDFQDNGVVSLTRFITSLTTSFKTKKHPTFYEKKEVSYEAQFNVIDNTSSDSLKAKILVYLESVINNGSEEVSIKDIYIDVDTGLQHAPYQDQEDFSNLSEAVESYLETQQEKNISPSTLQLIEQVQSKFDLLPEEGKQTVDQAIETLYKQPEHTQNHMVSARFLEEVLKIPFGKIIDDMPNLKTIKKSLNDSHFGLTEVKERVIEHIISQEVNSSNTSILLLAGPPGVGKTSITNSIAKAMNKEIIKISLGGVSEESEIRGHKQTFVGSSPGRIVKALQKAKTMNPIILLDEIDKIGFNSNTSSNVVNALLEVLDPSQNSKFRDAFIGFDIDISSVMFVATANYIQSIPTPLLDRMETIKLNQYSLEEKLSIASSHLIPKVKSDFKLDSTIFSFTEKTLKSIIENYTREPGVRSLNRTLSKIARKILVKSKMNKKIIDPNLNLKHYLNKPIILTQEKNGQEEIGIVQGMYYSAAGGGPLPIEVNTFPSATPILKLTGLAQEVMKESLEVALSFVKSKKEEYNLDFDFDKNSIHVHLPEAAVPKDGPSAGSAFTSALISALKKKPLIDTVAMTGEITLRGKVLPIGGLKEKITGSFDLGIKTFFIPIANKPDIFDIPTKIRKQIKIHTVHSYDQIYKKLFK